MNMNQRDVELRDVITSETVFVALEEGRQRRDGVAVILQSPVCSELCDASALGLSSRALVINVHRGNVSMAFR